MDLVRAVFGKTPWYGPVRNFQHLLEAIWAVIKNGYPARDMIVIGVTGTDGKTTTVHLIGEILKEAGFRVAVISTLGAYFYGRNLRQVDTGFHVTTPDARDIQELLGRAHSSGMTHVVLETTSHGLDQHRVFGCNFKVGVLTNITHEHFDYHKTFERYRGAKAKLFNSVDVAVINKDDAAFSYIKNVTKPKSRVISYSATKHATIVGKSVAFAASGMEIDIRDGKKSSRLTTRLVGDYNVSNILAACGVARGFNIPWDTIKSAISNFKGLAGRLERVKNNKGFTVFVDFAHTPAALENVLVTLEGLRESENSKIILVFGCPGQRDVGKRPLMGRVAAAHADFTVLTTDDPRHEDPEKITDAITRGIRQDAKVWDGQNRWRSGGRWIIRVMDRGEAIAFAVEKLAKRGDIVLLAGQGHQRAMPFGDREIPWSDQEAAKVALRGGVKRMRL